MGVWLELSGSETVSRTGEHATLCSAPDWVMPWEGGHAFHCGALLGTSPPRTRVSLTCGG